MGIILIAGAIVIFYYGWNQSALIAIAFYPLAIVALLTGIGLEILSSKINRNKAVQDKDYGELMGRIEDLEKELDKYNRALDKLDRELEKHDRELDNHDAKLEKLRNASIRMINQINGPSLSRPQDDDIE